MNVVDQERPPKGNPPQKQPKRNEFWVVNVDYVRLLSQCDAEGYPGANRHAGQLRPAHADWTDAYLVACARSMPTGREEDAITCLCLCARFRVEDAPVERFMHR